MADLANELAAREIAKLRLVDDDDPQVFSFSTARIASFPSDSYVEYTFAEGETYFGTEPMENCRDGGLSFRREHRRQSAIDRAARQLDRRLRSALDAAKASQ